jgi:hypothetical protein
LSFEEGFSILTPQVFERNLLSHFHP